MNGRVAARRTVTFAVAGSIVLAGCGTLTPSSPQSPTAVAARAIPDGEVDRSIAVRQENGLRADRPWVIGVLGGSDTVLRFGIRVTPDEAAEIDTRDLREAIRLREAAGVQADEAFVRALLGDPDAVTRMGGDLWLAPEEAVAWDRRMANSRSAIRTLNAYGRAHPEEWAGLYRGETGFVVLASDHAEEHRAAIEALFLPGSVAFEVREVRYSTRELRRLERRVRKSLGWLRKQGLTFTGLGIDTSENRVSLDVETIKDSEGLADMVIDHFDGHDWLMVEVTTDRTVLLPFGSLVVTVVDAAGDPVEGVWCVLTPDVPGAAGDHVARDTDERGQCRWDASGPRIRATGYTVEVWTRIDGALLASDRIRVPPHDTGRLRIELTR